MKYLEELAKIPSARLVLNVALVIALLYALEQFAWFQSVAEFLLNMEGTTP